jgi:hypothetical protein
MAWRKGKEKDALMSAENHPHRGTSHFRQVRHNSRQRISLNMSKQKKRFQETGAQSCPPALHPFRHSLGEGGSFSGGGLAAPQLPSEGGSNQIRASHTTKTPENVPTFPSVVKPGQAWSSLVKPSIQCI